MKNCKLNERGKLCTASSIEVNVDGETDIQETLANLSLDRTLLDNIYESYPHADKPDIPLRLHIGLVASGSAVVADDEIVNSVLRYNRNWSLKWKSSECTMLLTIVLSLDQQVFQLNPFATLPFRIRTIVSTNMRRGPVVVLCMN